MARAMKDSGVEWIGEIPEGWRVIKLKRIFDIIGGNGFPDSLQGNSTGDYPFCKVSDINGNTDQIDTAANWVSQSVIDNNGFNIVPRGSILMAKIGAALAKNHRKINTIDCCIDNNTQALVPKRDDSLRYLFYLSKCIDMHWFDNNSTVPSINNTKLLNSFVPDVPQSEQVLIVDVLDADCARIDELIEQTRASIDEYKKLKQALIAQTITKGIRPNREMKSSKVEWIETIPAEWSMERGKALFVEADKRSEDGSEELLTVSQYTGVTPRSQKNVTMFEAETLEGYKICEIGDIAANTMWLWAGAIGVSQYRGVISLSYNIYRQKDAAYNPIYLDYLLRISPLVQHYESLSTGIRASRLRLYPQQFLNIRFPVPPMDEQQEIVCYLKEKTDGMDSLIQKKQSFLSELEAYKKSLIFEYVTGKKEVPV